MAFAVRHPLTLLAFAAEGIRLLEMSRVGGMLILSTRRVTSPPVHSTSSLAREPVAAATAPSSSRTTSASGNVLVTYGGQDEQLVEGVEVAVDSLR